MANDLTLGDLVTAFRVELKDGLAKLDVLTRTLQQFETGAKANLTSVGDTADQQSKRMATSFGQGMETALSHVGRFVIGLIGVGGILEALRRVGQAFISANTEQEQYVNRLQAVTGSAAAAASELERLEGFAARTGVNLRDLVDAYISLRQRGVQPTEEALTGLGNAAVASTLGMGQVAELLTYAVQDAGRGLKQFGITMTQTAAKATFEWADASGKMQRTIVDNTDLMISKTLIAIWNEKYKGRMADFALTWTGMWGRMREVASQALTNVGQAGAWTELKAQFAALSGELQALEGQDLATWATATSNVITPIAHAVGSIATAAAEVPLALQVMGDFMARTFANLMLVPEKIILAWMQVSRVMLSVMPGSAKQAKVLDDAIVEVKGAIADTTFAAGDLDRQMHANIGTLIGMQQAGMKAAEGVRALASSHRTARGDVDSLMDGINAANSAFDQEGESLLKLFGVFNETKIKTEMADIVEQAYKLHEHGVPAAEALGAVKEKVALLSTTYDRDFRDKFTMPTDFERLKTAVDTGKIGMEDFNRYMDDEAWKKLKTGASDTVIAIDKAGGGIAEALKGGFDRGMGDALASANKKIDTWITVQASKKITISVDISDTDFLAKLQRLGYVPNNPNRQRTEGAG